MDGAEAKADLATVCHWYEEAPNVTSSTRVVIAVLVVLIILVTGTMLWYVLYEVLHKVAPDSNILTALGAVIATLAVHCGAAIGFRNTGV